MKSLMYLTIMATILFSGINTAFADESTEQEIRTLRAENKMFRATIKRQKKQIEAQQEKINLLEAQLLQSEKSKKKLSAVSQETKIKKNKTTELITRTKLISIAKKYLHTPENLTQAKREIYRAKISAKTDGELVDQHIQLQGTLQDVLTTDSPRGFLVTVRYRKYSKQHGFLSEDIHISFVTTDQRVVDLERGINVTVEGIIKEDFTIRSMGRREDVFIKLNLKDGKITKKSR